MQPTTTTQQGGGGAVDAEILAFIPDRGSYREGETVRAQVVVRNTGTRRHTFYVGYSAIGPNGTDYHNGDRTSTTGSPVPLDPGERKTVTVAWQVERDAPPGVYDLLTIVWKEHTPATIETKLDRAVVKNAIRVEDRPDSDG